MAERIIGAQPVQVAGARLIAAPFQFLTTDDDNLRVESVNSLAGVVIAIQGRRIDERGFTVPFVFTHTPKSDRTVATSNFKFGRGALLNLTVFASAGAPLSGQTYVVVKLIQGLTGATIVLGTLLSGYVTATQPLGWPGSPIVRSTDGEPALRTITGTTPGVGTDFSETAPTGARWELVILFSRLTTSAAAPTRLPQLRWNTAGLQVGRFINTVAQGPSVVGRYTWAPNLPSVGDTVNLAWTTPTHGRPLLLAGDSFASETINRDAGDQWDAPRYLVREWLEVN